MTNSPAHIESQQDRIERKLDMLMEYLGIDHPQKQTQAQIREMVKNKLHTLKKGAIGRACP